MSNMKLSTTSMTSKPIDLPAPGYFFALDCKYVLNEIAPINTIFGIRNMFCFDYILRDASARFCLLLRADLSI